MTNNCTPPANSSNGIADASEVRDESPYLSVVVPCYNEAEGLPELHKRLHRVCSDLLKPFEIIMVNDGSTDATWDVIRHFVALGQSTIGVNLSRNFGQQPALVAGLRIARGDRVLVIDADLQDPPELLPRMLELMNNGADVVYGQRRSRRGEPISKRFTAAAFYRFLNVLVDVRGPNDCGDFRLISRRVLEVFLSMPERHLFVRGMINWVGFRQVAIEFDREARFAGVTKWSFRKMLTLATDAVVSFSTKPLRLALICGCMPFALGGALAVYTLAAWYASRQFPGAAAIGAVICLIEAMHFAVLGILGEYVARMHQQSQGRPLYVIESVERQRRAAGRPGETPLAFEIQGRS